MMEKGHTDLSLGNYILVETVLLMVLCLLNKTPRLPMNITLGNLKCYRRGLGGRKKKRKRVQIKPFCNDVEAAPSAFYLQFLPAEQLCHQSLDLANLEGYKDHWREGNVVFLFKMQGLKFFLPTIEKERSNLLSLL